MVTAESMSAALKAWWSESRHEAPPDLMNADQWAEFYASLPETEKRRAMERKRESDRYRHSAATTALLPMRDAHSRPEFGLLRWWLYCDRVTYQASAVRIRRALS